MKYLKCLKTEFFSSVHFTLNIKPYLYNTLTTVSFLLHNSAFTIFFFLVLYFQLFSANLEKYFILLFSVSFKFYFRYQFLFFYLNNTTIINNLTAPSYTFNSPKQPLCTAHLLLTVIKLKISHEFQNILPLSHPAIAIPETLHFFTVKQYINILCRHFRLS